MPLTGTGDNAYMGSRERTSYCMPCDRVVVWKTWRVWQKHLGSAEHRECLVSPRPLPPDRLRPADLDDGAYGLAEGESVVFRRPDGLWIGLAALDGGATLRIDASQRQIAIERLQYLRVFFTVSDPGFVVRSVADNVDSTSRAPARIAAS